MIKFLLIALFTIFGAYLVIKMFMWFIPYLLLGGGVYLGYRWVDNKMKLGETKTPKLGDEIKEVDVKVIEEEPQVKEEPKSLEERIQKLKEGGA